MKKITLVVGLALILVVPAVSVAKPTPDKGDKRAANDSNAAKKDPLECGSFGSHGAWQPRQRPNLGRV